MLVCNVSQLARRAAIAAGIVEAASALDAPGTGNVVFATLVDDPASVVDLVDAYLGEIMLEAASALDALDGAVPAVYSVNIVEAATSTDTQAVMTATLATFDGAAVVTTLSNGNLTATHTSTTTPAGVRSTQLKTSGKYYFEVTYGAAHGSVDFMGIILSTAAVGDPTSGANVTAVYPNQPSVAIYSSNVYQGGLAIPFVLGDVMGVAIDLDNRKAWFRRNTGAWNAGISGTQDPATTQGGVVIASGSWTPAVGFLGAGSATSDNFTANFGQTAFAVAAPAGFGLWSV